MKHNIVSVFTAVILLLISFFLRSEAYGWPLIISLIIIYLTITIYGVFQIKANYFLNSQNRGKTESVAFTFDDGPDPELTLKILELLKSEKILATFFVIGKKAEQHPQLIDEIYKQGHVISNHTYSHNNMIGFFSSNKLKNDIEKCSLVIKKLIGKKPLYFRPPYGVTNPAYKRALKKLKLTSIGWTVRSFDTSIKQKEKFILRATALIKPGSIILFHDTQKIILKTLPEIIQFCRKQNMKIVPLHEIINQSPYENDKV